ncbi:5,6-dimethylbenzimidazole synthase, partial [Streptomonospora sp. S1-112]|nr:5,6-dimethylbenzimidazole synthase [Streptomonospora mangrovi]
MTGEDHRHRRPDDDRPPAKGLLDDLPETGRGAGGAPRPAAARPNPFHVPQKRPAGGPRPNVIPFRGVGFDRTAAVPADPAPEPAAQPRTESAATEASPAPEAPAAPAAPERPGGSAASAERAPGPARRPAAR